jgi:hypothetical protein
VGIISEEVGNKGGGGSLRKLDTIEMGLLMLGRGRSRAEEIRNNRDRD